MKLELCDGLSNNSDYSSDSQNSQTSSDFIATVTTTVVTPTSFISLDGLNSGVPTRTTPTLTPTTLRNIEQTFIELQSESDNHQNEAGFVPPLVHTLGNDQYITAAEVELTSGNSKGSVSSTTSMWSAGGSDCSSMRSTPPATPSLNSKQIATPTTRRGTGGRRPNKHLNVSPEEEERRNVRRERNKMAAARCRKRRLDHTNALLQETEGLEAKKQALQAEIQQLQQDRDDLEFILQTHRACCRRQLGVGVSRPNSPLDIKPPLVGLPLMEGNRIESKLISDNIRVKTEYIDQLTPNPFTTESQKPLLSSVAFSKPNRPSSLNVSHTTFAQPPLKTTVIDIAGIPITTPSTGIPFNFDSLMEGGTGLTPVSGPLIPTCSSQQRTSNCGQLQNGDLVTPDAPPCSSKLVSL